MFYHDKYYNQESKRHYESPEETLTQRDNERVQITPWGQIRKDFQSKGHLNHILKSENVLAMEKGIRSSENIINNKQPLENVSNGELEAGW